jgi:DNA-directed RNA polymerase specialized sigma24 family protein
VTIKECHALRYKPRSQLSDLELLVALCSMHSDEGPYKEFVNRFYSDLQSECLRICKARKLDKHVGIQIAHETFEKVRKYKSFQVDQVKMTDSRKGILVYLIRISLNLFNNHHNKEKRQNEIANHKSYFEDLSQSTEQIDDPVKLERIKELTLHAFKRLSLREQKVILADIEYKRHYKYLPDDVTDKLATELKVKKDTIRKIRERAKTKIKKAIDEFN